MKDFNWASVFVVLPLAHLLLASTYLYAYCVGFGAHIAAFVSVTDIFSTSIRNVASLYMFGAAVTVLSMRSELLHWLSNHGAKPRLAYGPPRPVRMSRWVSVLLSSALIGSGGLAVVGSYLSGRAIDVTMFAIVLLACLTVPNSWLFRIHPTRVGYIAIFSTFALGAALATGAHAGQEDRHGTFDYQKSRNSQCGDYVVLRRFSDLYLAIGADGRHHFVDKDCKAKIDVPPVKPTIDVARLPPAIRWYFGSF